MICESPKQNAINRFCSCTARALVDDPVARERLQKGARCPAIMRLRAYINCRRPSRTSQRVAVPHHARALRQHLSDNRSLSRTPGGWSTAAGIADAIACQTVPDDLYFRGVGKNW